ncbi:hypothetical protein J1N35_024165 [Gossypium stocksii]|uniref:Uncharacterized protein n=1 Tax=Gossypium stocksii TaxID=47602 RepID=A0A9D3VKY3_9ROSI|nr:hypothetical protein J1N35_024165 [Gossypium stocksii]
MPSFAECFNPERPVRTVARLEDIYSILLQYPPRKPVLVGPNYQSGIPEWDSQVTRNASNCKEAFEIASRYEREVIGTCIMPIPTLESSALHVVEMVKEWASKIILDGGVGSFGEAKGGFMAVVMDEVLPLDDIEIGSWVESDWVFTRALSLLLFSFFFFFFFFFSSSSSYVIKGFFFNFYCGHPTWQVYLPHQLVNLSHQQSR